ncbi:Anp1p [Sugiyamaella lignohabitans]|uniref:Anp1p n=1 Tax=Sugiyamaella lignohabitans TaxID=796027 RepID=A0A161HHQ3_9ASCO|nr:Anp1p [Sugiyamaella lignohabitans]ANB11737.1 Anp1p [Sugiyamaella lignohabitans]
MSLPFKSSEFDHYGGPFMKFHPRASAKKHSSWFSSNLSTVSNTSKKLVYIICLPLLILSLILFPSLRPSVHMPGFFSVSSSLMQDDPNIDSVFHYDLADSKGTGQGWTKNERILYLVPLRDAAPHLNMFFGHMVNLTYPHNLIDLAFLVSDSKDNTLEALREHLVTLQEDPDPSKRFGTIDIYEKDFGQAIGQGFSDRHGFEAQGPRRKLMARARNWLLGVALKPYHSWVYWRDADVQTVPPTILEDLMGHDKDVIVPNVWRPLPDWLGNEQPYDLNSWQESETSLQLANQLDEDAVIVEGYVEYATWRPHLAYLRDPYGDPTVEMELDGIGGVSILAKASVFRSGAHFPAFSFEKHAETEGFGKMCRRMGYSVVGLPHYTIWHIYEPSSDDLKHMEWMAQEEERQHKEEKLRELRDRIWAAGFEDVGNEWRIERANILKNTEQDELPLNQEWYGNSKIPGGRLASIDDEKDISIGARAAGVGSGSKGKKKAN